MLVADFAIQNNVRSYPAQHEMILEEDRLRKRG